MPQNGLSVGKDQVLDVVTPSGPLRLGLLTNFTKQQDTTEQRIKGKDGISRHLRFFDGWSGTFEIERQDSLVENYFVQLEANYYAGLSEGPVTITETITEPDGSLSQYRYVGVVLKLSNAGGWSGDATVKQSLSWMASRCVKVV